jgi:hypothetical protein
MKREDLYALIDLAFSQRGDDSIGGVRSLRAELEWLERRAVHRARADGLSWASIGRLLDVSPQGARQRFGKTVPPFRPDRLTDAEKSEAAFRALLAGRRHVGHDRENDNDPIAW